MGSPKMFSTSEESRGVEISVHDPNSDLSMGFPLWRFHAFLWSRIYLARIFFLMMPSTALAIWVLSVSFVVSQKAL